MGFFHHLHRTSSASSARSASAFHTSRSSYTPRTSTDSADDFMTATLKPHIDTTSAPLLDLPFEIVQHIASYLDDASAAKFSLSSRRICYTLGTRRLSDYIATSPSRFDARSRLEETIERAFPGAWLCAWCDKFHLWAYSDGPASRTETLNSPCAEYNSFLTDNAGWTLRYHHLRLALASSRHGAAHGIPLSSLSHTSSSSMKLFNTPVQTSISHSVRVVQNRLLLHTSLSLLLPSWTAQKRSLISTLFPLLPPVLTTHRATANGHSNLMAALDNVIRRGWRVLGAQACDGCATDWAVSSHAVPRSVAGEFVRVSIQVWRDLGDGKGPFEAQWRAHGGHITGNEEACGREARRERGNVREAFEGGEIPGDEGLNDTGSVSGSEEGWERLQYSWQMDRQRREQRDQEAEWRAIWKYIERRAGAEAVES